MNTNPSEAKEAFDRLYSIVKRLRAPDGCPWDREQTPASIRANLIEEAYELVEAINEGDKAHICEELGDMYLLPTMFAVMYEEYGDFKPADALNAITDKIIRRHPHVFGDATADTPDAVIHRWNQIKETVEGRRKKNSALDGVPKGLPPLERSYKLQKAAAKVGFDWDDEHGPWDKLQEELTEAREACGMLEKQKTGSVEDIAETERLHARLEDEIGDILFSVVNVARKHKVDPAVALHRALEKFSSRFRHVEKAMERDGHTMEKGKLELMDTYWDEAKKTGL